MGIDPNSFSEEELRSTPQEAKERLAGLPKLASGAFDLDSMTPEQRATYWEEKAKASTRGFHSYKADTDRTIDELRQRGTQTVNEPNAGSDQDPSYQDVLKQAGITDPTAISVLTKIAETAEARSYSRMRNDPTFVSSVEGAARARIDAAFEKVAELEGYEKIGKYKQEIIQKYFDDLSAVPEDVYSVLLPLAGSTLYEHRDDLKNESEPTHDRVNMLGGQGGERNGDQGSRTMQQWERLAKENPQAFSDPEIKKQFDADMAKLKS